MFILRPKHATYHKILKQAQCYKWQVPISPREGRAVRANVELKEVNGFLGLPYVGYHLDFQVSPVSAQARASSTFGKVTQALPSGRCREFKSCRKVWLAALRPCMVCPVPGPPLHLALSEA